jgi:hypothetical protein
LFFLTADENDVKAAALQSSSAATQQCSKAAAQHSSSAAKTQRSKATAQQSSSAAKQQRSNAAVEVCVGRKMGRKMQGPCKGEFSVQQCEVKFALP